MNRPTIPPEQLSGKIVRAKDAVLKAQRGADKLYERFIENAESQEALDRWLAACDRVCDAQEEETRLTLMVYEWRRLLAEEAKQTDLDIQSTAAKLYNLRDKRAKIERQLHLLY